MTMLIHPGFHKTATTWLQERVFSQRDIFRSLLGHQEIDELLVRPHDQDFDNASVRAVIDRLHSTADDGVVDVLSSEILTGNILFGSRDSRSLMDRLAATCPGSRVLLTVRSQRSIAQSIYLQYVKRGGRLDPADFFSLRPEPGYFGFDPGSLDFGRLAQAYADRFGKENVLALPQELLRQDRREYLRLLFDFARARFPDMSDEIHSAPSAGKSPPASGIRLMRVANSMRNSPITPGSAGPLASLGDALQGLGYRWKIGEATAARRLRAQIHAALDRDYASSNAILQTYCPVDLASLGYHMPD